MRQDVSDEEDAILLGEIWEAWIWNPKSEKEKIFCNRKH